VAVQVLPPFDERKTPMFVLDEVLASAIDAYSVLPELSLAAIPMSMRPMADCAGSVPDVRRVKWMVEQVEPMDVALKMPLPFGAFGELPKGFPSVAYASVEEANPTNVDIWSGRMLVQADPPLSEQYTPSVGPSANCVCAPARTICGFAGFTAT